MDWDYELDSLYSSNTKLLIDVENEVYLLINKVNENIVRIQLNDIKFNQFLEIYDTTNDVDFSYNKEYHLNTRNSYEISYDGIVILTLESFSGWNLRLDKDLIKNTALDTQRDRVFVIEK